MSILEHSIKELSQLLKQKKLSSVELTQQYLERIKNLDNSIGAYLSVNEEQAIASAKNADTHGRFDSPLSGIPVAIKDVICTQGLRTTAASRILEKFIPPYDATVIDRLKKQNAVVIGKTNCDEFAMGSSNENSAFKPCKNPWDLSRVPGGSSGGSAAAVSARLAPISLGTDTGGSIRQPAALCGIVGLKPTYGRVSRFGVVAFASSLDQVGPFAKTVEDAAILLDAISGHDPFDSTSVSMPPTQIANHLNPGMEGLTIGVPKEFTSSDLPTHVQTNFDQAIKQFESLGAKVVSISLPHTSYAISCYYIIAPAEASSNLSRYDGIRYTLRKGEESGLSQIYEQSRTQGFGKEVKRRILLGTFVLSAGYYDAYYKKALDVRRAIRKDFEDAFKIVDVIATPTTPGEAFRLGEKTQDPMQMYLSDIFTVSTPLSGNPAISIPSGFAGNLPLGLQLIGRHFDEQTIFNTAFAFEKQTQFYKKVPTL